MATQVMELEPIQLTPESFRPYGAVIRKPDTEPQLAIGEAESWDIPFDADTPAKIMFNRFHRGDGEFNLLERHSGVTQCFFPLGQTGFIMVVSERTAGNASPDPHAVKAFVVEGAQGLLLWRGTWHSIARFPLRTPFVDFAFVTDEATQRDLEECKTFSDAPHLTDYADFARSHDLKFRIAGYAAEDAR